MEGSAEKNPRSRGKADVEDRIGRLQKFETWAEPRLTRIPYETLFASSQWETHVENLAAVVKSLADAEEHALALRTRAEEYVRESAAKNVQSDPAPPVSDDKGNMI
jgi:hypothetical protein